MRRGLRAFPKRLPPKCFYDELGSALFEAITHLPEYYLTRAENELLTLYAGEIVDALGAPFELMELGSGSATKTRHLISAGLRRQEALIYRPIDISRAALLSSAQALVEEYPALRVEGYVGDYFALLDGVELRTTARTMALFLGSNIGNFEPAEALTLLQGLRRNLKLGDALLLGTDLKKSIERLELAYDDPAGVTAAFNKNVLGRINRELGGNFDLRAFEHDAHFDAQRGAMDMFLIATSAQKVRVRDLDLQISFAEFESIHTESSYKYAPDDIDRLAGESGYKLERCWIDAGVDYALSLLSVA
ncbi:MAG: L-histidine N(alpha)-methyltransferase [Candidatus Eremiobacteraeota bacterium]|nr:L-histidine N(alpha)-methyltransferase [Candidatus Eremiobacteraeota bacterium]